MSGRILLVCAVIAVPCLPESVDASNSEFVPAAAIPCAPLTDLKRSNAWEDLSVWLHTAPFQPLFALGATLAGLLCVWDGPALWHVLFTASSALAACGFAHSEARNSDFDEVSALFVAIFTGAAVGLCCLLPTTSVGHCACWSVTRLYWGVRLTAPFRPLKRRGCAF